MPTYEIIWEIMEWVEAGKEEEAAEKFLEMLRLGEIYPIKSDLKIRELPEEEGC